MHGVGGEDAPFATKDDTVPAADEITEPIDIRGGGGEEEGEIFLLPQFTTFFEKFRRQQQLDQMYNKSGQGRRRRCGRKTKFRID